MITIESENLKVQIDELGAEMKSIYHRQKQIEYLWQRDQTIWKSSSPVVFPVIGKLHNLEYRLDDKTYTMRSNGILRYEYIPIYKQGKDFVEFLFVSNKKTKKQYPFDCRVKLRYEVKASLVIVSATIMNDDTKPLYYNYAGHPGFNIPLYPDEFCDDYYIEFSERETVNIYDVCESGQLRNKQIPFFYEEQRFFIRKNLFQKEALAFIHPRSKQVSIKSIKNDTSITLNMEGFDHLGIWSPYIADKPLSFVCIEPWIGHTDFMGYEGDFKDRDGVASLNSGDSRQHCYSMNFT